MISPLQKKRLEYKPKVPQILEAECSFEKLTPPSPDEALRKLFPHTFETPSYRLVEGKAQMRRLRIGVVFSGGQAPGGHNVITGIFDSGATVIGFLDGPSGLVENRFKEINDVTNYRNQGGFDLIGSGRTKIETVSQMESAMKSCQAHDLDGLVIIGGDDSNTNAAMLAEYFLAQQVKTRVIGTPKTIDGDLRSEDIELSFGFDSATKTYAELIGNIARDAISAKKYYHFIKLMGRSASHIALECAFLTQPNFTLIGEERKSLEVIVSEIADLIEKRFEKGLSYGIILIPEGLVEMIPELSQSMQDLPKDPHGNVELAKIETEKLIVDLVEKELRKRAFKGKFNALCHSFGYEGRSCMPTNFDADYGYCLGRLASLAVREGLTGVICAIRKLKQGVKHWEMKMVPIISLMHLEMRLGKEKPVIKKTLVDIKGKSFIKFLASKNEWALVDQYVYPGPIQYFGDEEITDTPPMTLM